MTYSPFKSVPEDLDNISIIKQTQTVRFKAIEHLVEGTKGLPSDPKERDLLMKLLDSADRAAINLKRIDSSEKQGDLDREAALLTTRVLARIQTNPFESKSGGVGVDFSELEDPALDGHAPVPGEMEIGVQEISYESVMSGKDDG